MDLERYERAGENALRGGDERAEIRRYVSEPYSYLEEELRRIRSAAGERTLRLVDFCCGTGEHSVRAAVLGFDVTGIDSSAKSVAAAQRFSQANNLADRCQFLVGDAIESLSPLEPFDVVYCSGSLYYFDWKQAFPKVTKKIARGGLFLCVETNGSNSLLSAYRKLRNRIRPHRDEQTLQRLLRLADFAAISRAFPQVEIRYFDFLTLGGVFLQRWPKLAKHYHTIARRLDDFLLNRLRLRRLAFKVVLVGRVA